MVRGLGRVRLGVDAMVAVMERHGFTPADAMLAYNLVSEVAVGAASAAEAVAACGAAGFSPASPIVATTVLIGTV